MSGQERDLQAKQDYEAFIRWWEAKGYPDGISLDFSDARDAFASGMRAARAPAAEVRRAPCPVAGHDGEHFQWRAGDWVCGHVLAASLALAGVIPPPEPLGTQTAQESPGGPSARAD